MVRGWWWIRDTEELALTLRAMHPRGIREKVLHKHLAKHMDYLTDMFSRTVNGEARRQTNQLYHSHDLHRKQPVVITAP